MFTDARNNVYEHALENDNTNFSRVGSDGCVSFDYPAFFFLICVQIDVIQSPPPDLAVISVQVSNNGTIRTGDTIQVTYVVENEGAGPSFETNWEDRVVS